MPFGLDAIIIYLAARDQHLFWLYPLLATFGSLIGAFITFSIGRKAGELGLERLVPAPLLERIRARVKRKGAAALAVPAILPPPFPLTPLLLTCGALAVHKGAFFGTFALVRLVRFSAAAVLARIYGNSILSVIEAYAFEAVAAGFIVMAIVGTIISAWLLWRNGHQPPAHA